MCGIAGFIDLDAKTADETLRATALQMSANLRHRGPDDEGVWCDAASGVALSHRRLSIIDLSSTGHQPMFSAHGRYVVVYNGEIYNFQELREELENSASEVQFRGHSDTEVMLACLEQWGLKESLQRWNGMFAFAVWDREKRELHLGRDRLGEKPLYYSWMGNAFLFASELKALRVHPSFREEIDRDALALYLRYNCVPAPHCIYKGVFKLHAATFLTLTTANPRSARPIPYWSLRKAAEEGLAKPFGGSVEGATDQLEVLLRDAVKLRMVADVPLGVFLSGGVDSSTVTALMQAQSSRPVKSFSIGLREKEYNEATDAKAVAQSLQTEHTELFVTSTEAQEVIPLLPAVYDEPFADSSQIPTFLLARLTRQHVTVSLSGDGGDEVFGGYNRHVWSARLGKTIELVPEAVRRGLAAMLRGVPPRRWDSIFGMCAPFLPESLMHRIPGLKLHKLARALTADDADGAYQQLLSHWPDPGSVAHGSRETFTFPSKLQAGHRSPSFAEQMMFLDALTYLPDDILTKVDRATMAVGLEARVPFLDHRIVEFAWRLPLSMKVRRGRGKWILREVLHRYVPRSLVERPKSGFGIPLESWLRGPLREWAEELLRGPSLGEEEFLDPRPIRQMWADFLGGNGDWHSPLWSVLMFQAWRKEYRAKSRENMAGVVAAG
jgi:asparagine synthase (glutamine-hydrolysing)